MQTYFRLIGVPFLFSCFSVSVQCCSIFGLKPFVYRLRGCFFSLIFYRYYIYIRIVVWALICNWWRKTILFFFNYLRMTTITAAIISLIVLQKYCFFSGYAKEFAILFEFWWCRWGDYGKGMADGLSAEWMKKEVGWHPMEMKKNSGLTTDVGIECRRKQLYEPRLDNIRHNERRKRQMVSFFRAKGYCWDLSCWERDARMKPRRVL